MGPSRIQCCRCGAVRLLSCPEMAPMPPLRSTSQSGQRPQLFERHSHNRHLEIAMEIQGELMSSGTTWATRQEHSTWSPETARSSWGTSDPAVRIGAVNHWGERIRAAAPFVVGVSDHSPGGRRQSSQSTISQRTGRTTAIGDLKMITTKTNGFPLLSVKFKSPWERGHNIESTGIPGDH
jgi:hypothetical protein